MCALQHGFRTQVAHQDACDAEAAAVCALKKRAEDAEAKLNERTIALEAALHRVEIAEAAAKSMEASYDVINDALQDGKKREVKLRERAERAEADAEAAHKRAELAEAATRSIEAAYDVVAEALEKSKERLSKAGEVKKTDLA